MASVIVQSASAAKTASHRFAAVQSRGKRGILARATSASATKVGEVSTATSVNPHSLARTSFWATNGSAIMATVTMVAALCVKASSNAM